MKNFYFLILSGLILISLNSCEKKSGTFVTTSVSISLGASYTNDVFFRLSDGQMTVVPRSNWDIAFSVSPQEAAILTNGGSGVVLKSYPVTAGWLWATAIDTAGYYTWTALYNSDTTWTEGAFNMNATGHPNYGWGNYNGTSHNVEGNALYIIKLRNGSFKKIWIEMKYSALQKYSFRYSDLDGSNEQVVSNMDLSAAKTNFVYYNLQDNLKVDREPDATNWDIVFTKYRDKSINYTVTGVLQNIDVTSRESTDVDPLSEVLPSSGYLTNTSTIGSDWKIYSNNQYSIDETRVFLVKDLNKKVYRIRFKTFAGSATGDIAFDLSTNN
jgi:hypothetical protein